MTRRFARWHVALALVLTLTVVMANPVSAADQDQCKGVTVVVDDGTDVQARCAPDGVSGLQALDEAGFSVHTIDNGGFVCQIDGKPEKKKCKDSAHESSWYYYHATAGGSWEYSTVGPGNRQAHKGGYEGWHFGPKSPPDYAVDQSAGDSSPDTDGAESSQSDTHDSARLATWVAGAVVAVLLVGSVLVARRRR